MSFSCKWEKTEAADILTLSGIIDEHVDFSKVGDNEAKGEVIIDLAEVHALNSIGLKEWIKWVRNFQGRLTLRNCSISVVHHMNILEGFLPPKTKIESVEMPYVCTECGFEETMMQQIPPAAQLSKFKMPNEIKCTECGELSELDAVPDLYFQFLKKLK